MSEYIYLVWYESFRGRWGQETKLDKAFTIRKLAYEYRDMKNKSSQGNTRYIIKKKISDVEVF